MSRAPHIVMSLALSASLLVGCSRGTTDGPENPQTTGEESTSTGFPFDGSGGKEDAFGRSLVGIPRPYQPDPEMVADPLGQKVLLATNMRERRARAWDTARQVLEPVPLVGLASQIDRLPDCPAGVETRDIDRCENQSDEASCTGYTSGDASSVTGLVSPTRAAPRPAASPRPPPPPHPRYRASSMPSPPSALDLFSFFHFMRRF